MERIFRRGIAAAAVVAVAGACGTETLVYPGGPAGPAVAITLTKSEFALRVGQTATLGMEGVDEAGNAVTTAPTVTSCDASVVTVAAGAADEAWQGTATVTAVGMGESCLNVALGSLEEELTVSVGPVSLAIVGPDTVGSGESAAFAIDGLDASGGPAAGTAPVDWTSTNTARAVVNRETGEVFGRGTGTVTLQVRAAGGAANLKSVVVAPGTFAGTLSASAGIAGDLVTATRAAGAEPFDDDTEISVGSAAAIVDGVTADAVTFAVPGGVTGAQTLTISGIGPSQLAQTTQFTANGDDPQSQNPDAVTAASVVTPSGSIYGFVSGAAPDDFFTITAGASDLTVSVTLDWNTDADVDILWCDVGCANFVGNFDGASTAQPEASTVTIPAGTTWNLWINLFSGADSNYRIDITGI